MKEKVFTNYQVFVIALIALLQFTVVLDFMVLSPLGAQLMQELSLTTRQFSNVVSSYAFSAGIAGILVAGYADKYDRKKLLFWFYLGFIGGTFLCGIASSYYFLLFARILTGLFGGTIGAVGLAIITDLFRLEVRGRVMGFVQMAYALSQVLGIPLSLYAANIWGWHAPFMLIGVGSIPVSLSVLFYLKPVTAHLTQENRSSGLRHLYKVATRAVYIKAFATATILAIAVSMLMPFNTAFMVNNLNIPLANLPFIYVITGVCAIVSAPVTGKLSDKWGKYLVFCIGTVFCVVTIFIFCNLRQSTVWYVTLISSIMIVGILIRMITSSALISGVSSQTDRGAFMSINSAIQQFSGGVATLLAGMIVVKNKTGPLLHYDWLGYVIIASMLATLVGMYSINKFTHARQKALNQAENDNLVPGAIAKKLEAV